MAEAPASLVATGAGLTSFRVGGAGAPLVLLHGLQVGQELFDGLRVHLESSFTVITYDQRDRGETRFEPSGYTTDDLADDLAALIDALGLDRAHVLGTSFGGMIAQAFALRHPQRLDRLILGSTSQAPFQADRLPAPVAELLRALSAGENERARALLRTLAPAAVPAEHGGDEHTPPGSDDRLIRRFAATGSFDNRGRLGDIGAPTLVLHGRDDIAVAAADALAMAREIPGADVVILAGCGHAWENERPARAAAAITAFLAAAE